KLKVGLTLLKKQLGFRYLMDVIPLDAFLVKGSHGRRTDSPHEGPLLITRQRQLLETPTIDATEVARLILQHLGADEGAAQVQSGQRTPELAGRCPHGY